MGTIQTVVGALVALIGSWKPNNSITNDIEDGALLLATAHDAGASGAFVKIAQKIVGQSAAGLSNLQNGQAAVVGSFDGYTAVIVKDGGAAATSLGL